MRENARNQGSTRDLPCDSTFLQNRENHSMVDKQILVIGFPPKLWKMTNWGKGVHLSKKTA